MDAYLGKQNSDGSYQYHTIDTFPYFIAAMRGVVTLDPNTTAPENQIIPQAMTTPVRTANYGPLDGAVITGFTSTGTNAYSLSYSVNSVSGYRVDYGWTDAGLFTFTYVTPSGSTTENHQR